jgi:hypothetical protein
MLLSRFWYVVLAVTLGATIWALFLATSMYDRASVRAMGEALAGDSQVVASYLRDDARKRAIALIVPALDDEIRTNLAKSSGSPEKIPLDAKDKVKNALKKQAHGIPADQKFDAIFAVDQAGRVVAQVGFDQAGGIDNFELGGYPVVADALHGWVRDDSWVLGGRIYRVVGRPVENDVSQAPAGAIIGVRIVDDGFARELSKRTGAAVGFYALNTRVASGAPEDFDTAQLDVINQGMKALEADQTYKDKGFSDVRTVNDNLGVVYARLVGEAWDLGAGYAVARTAHLLGGPYGFLRSADDKDKSSVPFWILLVVAVIGAGVGLGFTFLEHTKPLHVFRTEAGRFAKGQTDQLVPSKFRGVYRKIASDVNDGVDKAAAKGGAPRKAADLEQVLGPMPAQPAMSAFSLPQDGTAERAPTPAPPTPRASGGGFPAAVAAPAPAPAPPAPKPPQPPPPKEPMGSSPNVGGAPPAPKGVRPPPAPRAGGPTPSPSPVGDAAPVGLKPPPAAGRPAGEPAPGIMSSIAGGVPSLYDNDGDDEATVVSQVPNEIVAALSSDRDTGRPPAPEDEGAEWKKVFEEFVRLKKECGEPTEALNFDKFKNTLRKNRDQLLQRHGCKAVRFSVYVKDGKAALKANPVRG